MTDAQKNVQFADSIRKEQLKMAPDQVNMAAAAGEGPNRLKNVETRQPNVMDEQFPTDALTSYNAKDREMNAKLQLGEGSETGYTPFGKLIAKDSDFKWAQEKQAAAELADFQAWFAREFDLMSPAQKKRAKELYPQFYAERKQLLRKQADNLFDLARIKLEGIDSYKDLVKTYMAETGRLDLGPLEHLLNPEGINKGANAAANNQARFVRGLANPFTVFGKEAIPMNVDTRQKESKKWARRERTDQWNNNVKLGVDGVGFPPMPGTDTNQSDKAWYQQLRTQLGSQ